MLEELKYYLIAQANKFNQFSDQGWENFRSCKTCVRKSYSYPCTCDDGWEKDQGGRCMNWTNGKIGELRA